MTGSLYIHIPFCRKKCAYCDFPSFAGKEDLIDAYVDKLTDEISFLLTTHHLLLSTIYFGGGTPTLLKPKHFRTLLAAIRENLLPLSGQGPACRTGRQALSLHDLTDKYHVVNASLPLEITVEANPGTINKTYLTTLRALGINRLSIGGQSFHDKHLHTLGRIHCAQDIHQAVAAAKNAGFDNINLDLMFALPGQSLPEWKKDLEAAVSLSLPHLSIYNLQIEEGTPLHAQKSQLALADEELDAQMYEFAIDYLTAQGYQHYEISNFAKPGFTCRHNLNYWQNGNYLGVGAGAHSHINGHRWSNPVDIDSYIKQTKFNVPPMDKGTSPDQKETIFMGLRLLAGLAEENFKGFEKEVSKLINEGLLIKENGKLRLSKRGLLLGNVVFEKFV